MSSHFVAKTDTPKDIKDLWRTPKDFFDRINQEFEFVLDACASLDNSLCGRHFCKSKNSLKQNWDFDGSVWCNPPYSLTSDFIDKAIDQAENCNVTIVMLVNANTDTKWFKRAYETANEIRLISGRLSFVRDDGEKASGNTKGQCLIIWRGNCKTPCQIVMIDRDEK